ncbi:hypothetical protein, partial [Nocardia salmonicida]|uniref:hypothetical protein n=1 Tax=Nocardia salmonicida TaxID=53431 RepID=UPI001C3FF17A
MPALLVEDVGGVLEGRIDSEDHGFVGVEPAFEPGTPGPGIQRPERQPRQEILGRDPSIGAIVTGERVDMLG